ncbi:ATP-grasp domain-containing protein [Candidatus Saccharibacteria bacterium]|nr:ATP-grasp domain-containing protein [Candidatus Saccharibacteria bacterium]
MKLSIVDCNPSGHKLVKCLIDIAADMGVKAAHIPITSTDIATGEITSKLSECIFWRASDLALGELMAGIGYMKDRITINTTVYSRPMTSGKLFQHLLFKHSTLSEYAIPTYRVGSLESFHEAMSAQKLEYPVVVKPNMGTTGKGIFLINNPDDASRISDWSDMIVTPYIESTGDYRVFVLGGVPFSAMRKIGNDDPADFVAKCTGVTRLTPENDEILKTITDIATRVASLLHLEYAGLDIIRDEKTSKYYVLEANVSGTWRNGYNETTGENIPREIIQWFIERHAAKSQPLRESLANYLDHRKSRLSPEKQVQVQRILDNKESPLTPDAMRTLGSRIINNFFATSIEDKCRYLYAAKHHKHHSNLIQLITSHAEKSVSWTGNFLTDDIGDTSTGLSLNHTLEYGVLATAYFIAATRP